MDSGFAENAVALVSNQGTFREVWEQEQVYQSVLKLVQKRWQSGPVKGQEMIFAREVGSLESGVELAKVAR